MSIIALIRISFAERKIFNDKKFYKKRGFWACVASGIAGLLAGTAGAGEFIASIIDYLF